MSKDLPKLYGFGTAGYGNPGYNIFKEGAAFFYTVGAKVTWNFWNWNQTSREKQILDLNSNIIENQKNAYDMANKAQVQQYLADVLKADELIKSDEEIIQLAEINHTFSRFATRKRNTNRNRICYRTTCRRTGFADPESS